MSRKGARRRSEREATANRRSREFNERLLAIAGGPPANPLPCAYENVLRLASWVRERDAQTLGVGWRLWYAVPPDGPTYYVGSEEV